MGEVTTDTPAGRHRSSAEQIDRPTDNPWPAGLPGAMAPGGCAGVSDWSETHSSAMGGVKTDALARQNKPVPGQTGRTRILINKKSPEIFPGA